MAAVETKVNGHEVVVDTDNRRWVHYQTDQGNNTRVMLDLAPNKADTLAAPIIGGILGLIPGTVSMAILQASEHREPRFVIGSLGIVLACTLTGAGMAIYKSFHPDNPPKI